ncbi:MAG: 2-oxoacid:acceptor oxidoreductase family protein, partial [Acetobacteraceae bacterium]|nr:2-oxoacid:acceptor oxidoreductase family protein [Acetobacteraceae bacterium]
TCNKDFSCLDGFCPSFVTVEGASRRGSSVDPARFIAEAAALPSPALPMLDQPYDLLITGVGGTGVITVGVLIAMAAHLEGRGASVLDFTGFAQKFGPVLSYLRLAADPAAIHQVRVDVGAADALIACDLVVATSPKASTVLRAGTRTVVNTAEMPTGDIVRHRDADLAIARRLQALGSVVGSTDLRATDANGLAEKLCGDTVFANVIMLGMAWQAGLVPVSHEALLRAIALNNVEVAKNTAAFAIGRLAAQAPASLPMPEPAQAESLDAIIERRRGFLAEYQDEAWSARYLAVVERVRAAERGRGDGRLTAAVARSLFKLMSYKDEYEVARLHMRTGFLDTLRADFAGNFRVHYHLAPPLLPLGKDARGRPRKVRLGQWVQVPFAALARLKRLRGTPFDPFGYTEERRMERGLIAWYEDVIARLLQVLPSGDSAKLAEIASAPLEIRGFGPVKRRAAETTKARVSASLKALAENVGS